jgi:signal recognition particle receptor subunit beta
VSHLTPGTRLEEYRIEEVLGSGAFGITYRATDTFLGMPVAIKEFFPRHLVQRRPDGSVAASSTEDASTFQWVMARFIGEGQVLARFRHPNIVRVWRYLTGNGTAYMVMDYEEGESLAEWLQRRDDPPTEADLRRIFLPVLEGLREVHRKRFLHRDIKPGNILLRSEGPPCLLDFGAAEVEAGAVRDTANVLTHGYAPVEQYSHRGKVGPASDLYAMGATMYRCVVGRVPGDARSRQRATEEGLGDPLLAATRLVRGRYTRELLDLIEWMVAIRPEDRPQSVDEVLARLGVGHGEPGAGPVRAAELSVHHRLLFVGPRGAGKRTALGTLGDGAASGRDARVAFGSPAPEGESVGYARLSLSGSGYLHLYAVSLPEQARIFQAALDRGVLGFVVLIDNRAEDPLADLDACLRFLEDLPAGARAAVGVTHTDLIPVPTVADLHAHLVSRSPHARRQSVPVFEVDARSPREVGLLVQALLYSVDPGA